MHGPLDEIGLIEVLQLLQRGRRSGVLRVSGADVDVAHDIVIADGLIVALLPEAGDAATLAALSARHLVTSSETADDPLLLSQPAAADARRQLARHALAAMMHWQRGRFDFAETQPATGPLSFSPDALVFALVSAESHRVELAEALDDFHAVPDFVADDRLAHGPIPELTPRDWRILDAIDGRRDVAAVAAAVAEPIAEVAAQIQALQAAAILELRRPPADGGVAARAAIEAGYYEEAATLLRARLAQHGGDGETWRALGLAEVGAGRFEHAIDAWQTWRDADPGRAADAVALMQAARTMVEALRDARE